MKADTNGTDSGSLEYWTEGSPNAQSIIDFVAAVTDETSVSYIPPEKRIAVFDVDGTLLGELFPTYFIDVPDAFELLQNYINSGKLKVSRYEDKTSAQLEWWYSAVADYMSEKNMIETPECSYARFVKNKIPRAWEIYLLRCGQISR